MPRKLSTQIIAEAEGVCHYCECHWASVVDHVRPVAQGGRMAIGNLVAACYRCNWEKSGRTPAEWRNWRLAQGMCWPPVNATYAMWDVCMTVPLPESDAERLFWAMKARDERVTDAVKAVHDRYHAGKPNPTEVDKALVMEQVALFVAERDV